LFPIFDCGPFVADHAGKPLQSGPITIDNSGNVWIANPSGIYIVTNTGLSSGLVPQQSPLLQSSSEWRVGVGVGGTQVFHMRQILPKVPSIAQAERQTISPRHFAPLANLPSLNEGKAVLILAAPRFIVIYHVIYYVKYHVTYHVTYHVV
jgi:hypothetical protein